MIVEIRPWRDAVTDVQGRAGRPLRRFVGRNTELPLGRQGHPYCGMPLWLQVEIRHGWLWAYNLGHLGLIRRFAQASLRERAPSYAGFWFPPW